jgi:hypothetical protein
MFAADATGVFSVPSSTARSLPVFPGEEPTAKELDDWLKEVLPTLRQLGYEASLRGQIPAPWLPLQVRDYVADPLSAAEAKVVGPVASR